MKIDNRTLVDEIYDLASLMGVYKIKVGGESFINISGKGDEKTYLRLQYYDFSKVDLESVKADLESMPDSRDLTENNYPNSK